MFKAIENINLWQRALYQFQNQKLLRSISYDIQLAKFNSTDFSIYQDFCYINIVFRTSFTFITSVRSLYYIVYFKQHISRFSQREKTANKIWVDIWALPLVQKIWLGLHPPSCIQCIHCEPRTILWICFTSKVAVGKTRKFDEFLSISSQLSFSNSPCTFSTHSLQQFIDSTLAPNIRFLLSSKVPSGRIHCKNKYKEYFLWSFALHKDCFERALLSRLLISI